MIYEREKLLECIENLEKQQKVISSKKYLENYIEEECSKRKLAEWIETSNKTRLGKKCSVCHARISYTDFFNGNHLYCHKCGSFMINGEKGNT